MWPGFVVTVALSVTSLCCNREVGEGQLWLKWLDLAVGRDAIASLVFLIYSSC